jgi:hypothetical protein
MFIYLYICYKAWFKLRFNLTIIKINSKMKKKLNCKSIDFEKEFDS